MGDRHGGRFARRGRALNPPHPQVDAPHGESLPTRRTSERICPRARTLSSAKASRHGARAKGFAPRRNTPLGEGLPTRRTGERICPAGQRSPRRRPPDTAHGRRDLPRAGTLSSAKASRHGARAKDSSRAGTRPTAKASRHGARAKGFAPRENAPLGESIPTRRTSKRICPHARTLSSAKASRHGARAKGFAPRRNTLLGEGLPTRRTSGKICPAGVRVRPTCRRTAGRPRSTDSRKTPFGGVAPERARPLPSSFT